MATIVNEGSTSYHPIEALNAEGLTVTPEGIRYRVTGAGGTEIVDWVTVDAATTEIEISSTVNIIGDYGKQRYLTVEVSHSGGDKITEELGYVLRNLKGIV